MVRVRPKRFPSGAVKKLHARGVGPFQILKRVDSNAYVVNIPPDYSISSTFNVSDLIAYREPTVIPSDPFKLSPPIESDTTLECPLAYTPVRREQKKSILDEQVITSQDGVRQRYLVHWRGRPQIENSWITREELQRLDPNLLE